MTVPNLAGGEDAGYGHDEGHQGAEGVQLQDVHLLGDVLAEQGAQQVDGVALEVPAQREIFSLKRHFSRVYDRSLNFSTLETTVGN